MLAKSVVLVLMDLGVTEKHDRPHILNNEQLTSGAMTNGRNANICLIY